MLKACATELGYEQHVRSDYGEEASFRTPWELFGQADAESAVGTAQRARSIARRVLERTSGSLRPRTDRRRRALRYCGCVRNQSM